MCFIIKFFKRYCELSGEMMMVLKIVEKSKYEIGKGGSKVLYMKIDLLYFEVRL